MGRKFLTIGQDIELDNPFKTLSRWDVISAAIQWNSVVAPGCQRALSVLFASRSVRLSLALAFLLAMLSPVAHSASFECGGTHTNVERLICADAGLSKRDDELSLAYKDRMEDRTQAVFIRQSQRQWLKERNDCSDVACLYDAYQSRLSALMAFGELHAPRVVSGARGHTARASVFDFSIEVGKELNICRDYVKSLAVLAPTDASLFCEMNIHPDAKQLGLPSWEDLEIEDHWDVVYEIERRTSYQFDKRLSRSAWRKQYKDRISKNYRDRLTSGAINPRLRRTKLRLVKGKPVLTLYGYTLYGDDIESCEKDVLEGTAQRDRRSYFLGEMIFILDESKNLLAEIVTGRPNHRETESIFYSRQPHHSFTHDSTLFFQTTIPILKNRSEIDRFVIWIYGVSNFSPNSSEYVNRSYSGAQICSINVNRKLDPLPRPEG